MKSKADEYIEENVITKGLENDSLYFEEGFTNKQMANNMKISELKDYMLKQELQDGCMSDGDEDDLNIKLEKIQNKDICKKDGMFEKSHYLRKLFPTLKIQKPGEDYYGSITLVLFMILLWTFISFDYLFVRSSDLLDVK